MRGTPPQAAGRTPRRLPPPAAGEGRHRKARAANGPLRRGRPRRLPFRLHPRPVRVGRRGVPARPAPGRGRPRTAAGTGSIHQGGAGASLGREPRQRCDDASPGRPDGDGQRQGPPLPAGDRRGAAGRPPPQRRPLDQQRLPDRREGVHALAGARPPHGRRSARLPVPHERRRRRAQSGGGRWKRRNCGRCWPRRPPRRPSSAA